MGGRNATFVDATPKRPCRVCRATHRCCEARDGRTVICFKESFWDGRPGKPLPSGPRGIGDRWSWYIGPRDGTPAPERPIEPVKESAPIETRDRVYSAMLDSLELAADHAERLTAGYPEGRAFPVAEVRARQYRTLRRERSRVAGALVRHFGADTIASVPGFYLHEASHGERPYWSIAGSSGLLIPVRDTEGRIQAFQIRRDDVRVGEPRYVWLSSSYHGGPGPGTPCHVPMHDFCAGVVRLTEGPLKGDAATILDPSGIPTVAVPGVATWRHAMDVLKALGAHTVHVAFDADVWTNPLVASAFKACFDELGVQGFQRRIETWREPKGIDDLLASGGRPELHEEAHG